MAFKMISQSEKTAGRVAGFAKELAETIAGEQVERWRGELPPDAGDVGIGQLQRFYAAELRRLCAAMVEAETAHIEQLTVIKLLRRERDAAASQVRFKAGSIALVLAGAYGEDVAERVLEKAAEVTDPVALTRVAALVAETLADPELTLPDPLVTMGVALDFEDLAREIAEPNATLSARLDDLEIELPRLNATLERKIKTHAAVKDLTKRLVRFLEGLYGLEEHDHLQRKVKALLKKAKKAAARVAESEEGAEAQDEDGRRRTAEERMAPREKSLAAFDEAEREARAEVLPFRPRFAGPGEAGSGQAEAQEAAAQVIPLVSGTAAATAAAGPSRPETQGSEDPASAVPVKISREASAPAPAADGGAEGATSPRAASATAEGEGASRSRGRRKASAGDGGGGDPGTSGAAGSRPRDEPQRE